MVNNSSNIKKTKESLKSDSQQFLPLSTESLNSDKRKFQKW